MPSFASLIAFPERMYDYSHAVWVIIRDIVYAVWGGNQVWSIVLYYIIFAFGFYFLVNYKFKDRLIAFYASVAAIFITPIIQFIIVGHNTKMIAIMMFPWVFLFLERILDRFIYGGKINIFRLILDFIVLVFVIHIQMSSNHIQMLFYFYLMLGVYLIYRIIYSVVKKSDVAAVIKSSIIFIIAIGFSAAMNADSYLSIKEYNKYSIRGVPSLESQKPENQNKQGSEPLDYEYATNWSFSPGEVMTLFIPYWQGFGDVEYKGQRANTYWGQMPFTTSPVYFGVLTLLLAFIGIYYNFRKNVLVQALSVISVLVLFISFGRTFPVLFDIMFKHFPYFSSFRAPVMIHIIINVSVVILACFGLKSVYDAAKDTALGRGFTKGVKYVIPILFLPILFSVIGFKGYYESVVNSSPLVQKLQAQNVPADQLKQYVSQVAAVAYDNVRSEMLIIGVLLIITYGACYYFIAGKLRYQYFMLLVALFVLIDLWHIDYKTLHWDTKADQESVFKTPDYVDYILKNETDLNSFRVLEMKGVTPVTSNNLAYYRLRNVIGYQGAKLRIVQDMLELATFSSPATYIPAGIKYVIADRAWRDLDFITVFSGSKNVWLNTRWRPPIYFVFSYRVLDAQRMMDSLKYSTIDVQREAIFETDPHLNIDPADTTIAKAKVTSFENHYISIDAEATGNNLLFVGEVYYPAGWKAYVDGMETQIYKTDYLYRSVVVPKGKHKVEFKFEPESYYTGKKITMASNIVLILLFVVSLGGIFLKKRKEKVS